MSAPAATRAAARVQLGDVIAPRNDIVHPRDNPTGPDVFVGLEHIESGTGRRIGSENVEKSELTGRKARFRAGDIVYGYLRPYLNKVWLADFDGLCSVDQYVYVVDQRQAEAEYIAWFMRSPLFLSRAPVDSGPGQLPRIRLDEIAQVQLDLPPLSEQKRIAAALREQLDAAARMRAAASNQARFAKASERAYLRTVWEGEWGRSWPLRRLDEAALLERGKFTPRPRNDPRYYGGIYPWIQTGDVEAADKYVTKHSGTLNEQGLAVSKLFPRGTLVMTIAASIGAVGILGFDSCMPDSLIGIAPKEGLADSEFLYYLFLHIRSQLESLAPKTAQANLKLATLNPLQVRIPCLEEQRRVVLLLNERFARTRRLSRAAEEQGAHVAAMPAALLCRAFSGGP